MRVDEIASFTTGLSVTPPASAGFSVPLLLVDTEDVPLDRRYLITARASYADELTADSDAYNWAAALWSQNYNPSQAYIGRWASTATSPYFVCGSPAPFGDTWTAVTAGDFAITDGGSTEKLSTGSMASCQSLADVCSVIQAAVRVSTTFADDLADATVSIDALNRIVIKSSKTGALATVYSIVAPTDGTGTDITGENYLNIASNAFSTAGIDAEDPDDAMAAVLALDDTPFVICVRGASIDQTVSLANALPSYKKVGEFVITDDDAKNSALTTDVGYQLTASSNKNAHIIYTEHTDQSPDAAIIGEVYPRPEGSASLAFNGISGCYESGLDADGTTIKPLTVSERTALENKGYDYLVKPVNSVHLRHGLTPAGVEMRHRIAFYWLDKRCSEAAYAYLIANDVVTFSDEDIQAVGGIFKGYADILVTRKVIEEGYTMNLPTASEFETTVKATHTLTLADMAEMMAQFAVNDIVATVSATV